MPSSPVIAVFDLDRTVTTAGTYTPFLIHCVGAGPRVLWTLARGLVAAIGYKLGHMTRAELKARMLAVSIAGAPRAQVQAWAEVFVERWFKSHVRPGAVAAIARHRAAGDKLVLATASFDFHAAVFARRLGFDHLIATGSVWDETDCLRAAVAGENCYGPAKLKAVKAYVEAFDQPVRVIAYSDHHTDADLLRWAHEGVAVNPNGKLRRMAVTAGLKAVDWN